MEEVIWMQKVSAIAHRGFSSAAPENTLAAFRQAIELGPEMMECDVRRSRDGRLVVIHDAKVDRTTNGTGLVADMTLAEIKALDAGSRFGPEFAGERIPTLEELLDLIKGTGVKLIIEIKEYGIEDQVVAIVQGKQVEDQIIIGSFHHKIGVRMPELDPKIPFSVIIAIDHPIGDEEAVRLADEAAAQNCRLYALNYQAATPAIIKAVHTGNMVMEVWTVDKEEDMRPMVEMGVDVIASNHLALLLRVLSDMGVRPDQQPGVA